MIINIVPCCVASIVGTGIPLCFRVIRVIRVHPFNYVYNVSVFSYHDLHFGSLVISLLAHPQH